ncbi:histidinol-phosphatase [Nitrosomonas sp. Nm34]|uniref:histidinol-phosphatase n=1 Tax=Nitrosomonas sp. Nm34 TaxID=1881055 RepID=UPI0008E276B5|nr:histidinol-phosphatase [Nitrosomonas sp. Nm34]SFI50828.1 histidinol-phosphatase, inositol monophosphatase family [Nitrosomonas sp. Nm34]
MSKLPNADFLHRLADIADAETMPRYRTELAVDTKFNEGDTFDPVTEADREAEISIRAAIEAEYPDHAILGEELGQTGNGSFRWVLDPVDGTRPFICGLPVWGTLIGLTVDGRAEMGMMSQPFIGERFWADVEGAWYERAGKRQRLFTRNVGALSEAILHTTSPEDYHGDLKQGFDRLAASVRMTRYGGECYALAMLAAGRIDLAVEPSLQPYDIVALIPIIEKAGGVVTRLDGKRAEEGGSVLVSATPTLHFEALRLLNGCA